MGSTGEPDRKRRHFGSLYSTATAKKQPLLSCSPSASSSSSEDKKLDVAVLQYQNQKLIQQLEAQRVEYLALESKFHQLKEKQKTYNDILLVVNKSWEWLIGDLEALSASTSRSTHGRHDFKNLQLSNDEASCPTKTDFLRRLLETCAGESCSDLRSPSLVEDDVQTAQSTTRHVLQNVISSLDELWCVNDKASGMLLGTLLEDEPSRQLQRTMSDLQIEIRNFRIAAGDLHLKHRLLADELQKHRDVSAKNKADSRCLSEELTSTIVELEESNSKLATLKAQKDLANGALLLFPTLRNKHVFGDKVRDKHKELLDLESTLKELTDLISSRLVEIKSLHEEKLEILNKLANLQNVLMDVKSITSSKAFQLLREQLEKSKSELDQCRISLEKLQVERDNFALLEKEVIMGTDLADVTQRISAFSESRIADLENELQRLVDQKILLETKLEEASREPGRKEIITEFKALVASLPKDMGVMQSQLSEYKEVATEIHSLHAEVQSLSSILHRKECELESLSGRSLHQLSEIEKLQAVVQDLRESDQELKLILEMYRCESTDAREVIESRNMEYKAWAQVQSLKSSLDEHNLELRVKAAIEAEAISQQKLATAEAEIADLRQKLKVSGRDICKLTEILKSKHEESETFLSEIESIGQAYEDMQTQNQHLLQQITERDDYNIKVVVEGVKARQLQDALQLELQTMDKEIQQGNSLMEIYNLKVANLEEQLNIWLEQVGKFVEDGWQSSVALENTQRRLLDVQRESQQLWQSLDGVQAKVERSRMDVAELLIVLEKERFNKKKIEEELELLAIKATHLRAQTEGLTVLEKLRQEIREYRGILKCSICHEREKEVVIAKCYHLFCSQCIQRTLKNRHRKCPTCAIIFGPNDVKPIYI